MDNKILLPAILTSYRPKADKSFTVTFNTNQLVPEQLLLIDRLHNQHVFLLIKDSEIDNAEQDLLDQVEVDFDSSKSLSQRLRAVLFVEFKQNPCGFTEFAQFYKYKMERAIESIKNKLDPK